MASSECPNQEDSPLLKAAMIELRKDLLNESVNYVEMSEEPEIPGHEEIETKEDGSVENHEQSLSYGQQPGASYTTLTNVQPTMGDESFNTADVSNVMANLMSYCSVPCWIPPHDDGMHYTATHMDFQNAYHYATSAEYTQNACSVAEDVYKSQPNIGHNSLYHYDTSSRRFWIPEPNSSRMEGNTVANDFTSSAIRRASSIPTDIFMASEIENDELFRQHAVSIERYPNPNRCWRGGSSARHTQEKGYFFNSDLVSTNFVTVTLTTIRLQEVGLRSRADANARHEPRL